MRIDISIALCVLALTAESPASALQRASQEPAKPSRPIVTDSEKTRPFALDKMELPTLPALPKLTQIEEGVFFAEVEVTWPRGSSKLWVYLPALDAAPRTLPTVVIAPAGSNLLFGMGLADGDRDEHVPYVKAGFAVVAYEIEGAMPDDDVPSNESVMRQLRGYIDCWAGLQDARLALEYALAEIPAVDPKKLFAAGHSSAATTALLFAAHEPRLRGCAAFAPIADVVERVPEESQATLEMAIPGYRNFVVRSSPNTHIRRFRMPLFVFSAEDDENVEFADTRAFVDNLRGAKKVVEFDTMPEGGHYDPMISAGIPHAIEWMQKLCAKKRAKR